MVKPPVSLIGLVHYADHGVREHPPARLCNYLSKKLVMCNVVGWANRNILKESRI